MRPLIALITLGAAVVFVYTLVHAVFIAPTADQAPVAPLVSTATGTPTRLAIPSIGVDAKVQEVGINKKGDMGVPTNYTDVAWYKLGTVPGQLGTAVIDGHVDNALSLPGVFKKLNEVKLGDELQVTMSDGSVVHFVVDEIQTYPLADVPRDRIFTRADAARLVLITCTGDWVQAQKTYDTRLVVYAHLVVP